MILRLQCFLVSAAVFLSAFSGAFTGCHGKPHPQDSTTTDIGKGTERLGLAQNSSPKIPNAAVGSRRLIASRTNDGFWSASSRLPTSSESGGNEHSRTKTFTDLTNGQDVDFDRGSSNNNSSIKPRNHRRLNKWVKSSEEGTAAEDTVMENQDDSSLLYQSIKTMETHLLDKVADESLENSSEKDIYLHEGTASSGGEDLSDEDLNEEEDENGNDPKTNLLSDNTSVGVLGDNDKLNQNVKSEMSPFKLQHMKHHHHGQHQQTTTPKGFVTWSDVQATAGSSITPHRGAVQKLPVDYTISQALVFSTQFSTQSTSSKPITTADIVTKDKTTEIMSTVAPTTAAPSPAVTTPTKATTSVKNPSKIQSTYSSPKPVKKVRPPNYGISLKKPAKYVKPPLEEVTAQVIGSDETHDIYSVKPISDVETKTSTPDMDNFTRQPGQIWPFMTTKKPAFTKVNTKISPRPHKNHLYQRTQAPKLTLTVATTSKPSTTTVYYRNPSSSLINPLIPISLSNMSFFDFLRTQLVPRIGLSLLSFMATSPILLTLMGAVAGRKKRDLTELTREEKLPAELEALASQWKEDLENTTEDPNGDGNDSEIQKRIRIKWTKKDRKKKPKKSTTVKPEILDRDLKNTRQSQTSTLQFSTIASVIFSQLFTSLRDYFSRFQQIQQLG